MRMDLKVSQGQIKSIIGPNGAGKTTLFNLITGFYRPDQGRIFFCGEEITGLPPESIAHLGIGRTFQLVRPFLNMTLLENVMVAALSRTSNIGEARRKALDVVESLDLDGKLKVPIRALTIEDRKRLELARAIALAPSLLLLDEVMAGLNPTESNDMIQLIKRIRNSGITILLIEHVMHAVLSLSDEVVVLNYGEKIYDGDPGRVVKDQQVIEAYLGEDYSLA
ncbi:MAG: ABC transporter ATP-binding protein [Deltaproteobacteria bacterium]|nr:ABC transporter ATP-binding protein [Deltaproteobacteria bacterium]